MSEESLQLRPRTANLSGRTFGILTVVSFAGYRQRNAYWLCLCRCGNSKPIAGHNLTRGNCVSCGCKSQQIKPDAVEKQPEYAPYRSMLDRCHNPTSYSYHRYGKRGVRVCDRWRKSFAAFVADIGRRPSPRHTLDRFPDKNGNYEPGNVRWALPKEQQRNLRTNRVIEFRGERKTMVEWAEQLGIAYVTLKTRLNRLGWSVERALTEQPTSGKAST